MARVIIVSPVRYGKTGYERCDEQDASLFSVSELKIEPRYGEGWFPLYSQEADAHGYMFRSKVSAEAFAAKERANHGL